MAPGDVGLSKSAISGQDAGDLLQELVNRISHRQGRTLSLMADNAVTLPQILLMNRVFAAERVTATSLALALDMSLSSISQMVERLHRLGFVRRAEIASDRRKKTIALTRKGKNLLCRIREARSAEYRAGIAQLSAPLRAELGVLLKRALAELRARDVSSERA